MDTERLSLAVDALQEAGCLAEDMKKLAKLILRGFFTTSSGSGAGTGAGAGAGAGAGSKKSTKPRIGLATQVKILKDTGDIKLIDPAGGEYVDFEAMAAANHKELSDANKNAYAIGTERAFKITPGIYDYNTIMALYKDQFPSEKAHAWCVMAPIVRCSPRWPGEGSTLAEAIEATEGLMRITIDDE